MSPGSGTGINSSRPKESKENFIFQGPYRHYVLNFLWILINLLCLTLTMYHLRKLYQDFTSPDLEAVRIMSLFASLPSIKYQVIQSMTMHH